MLSAARPEPPIPIPETQSAFIGSHNEAFSVVAIRVNEFVALSIGVASPSPKSESRFTRLRDPHFLKSLEKLRAGINVRFNPRLRQVTTS